VEREKASLGIYQSTLRFVIVRQRKLDNLDPRAVLAERLD
jgi:hypothetical protein